MSEIRTVEDAYRCIAEHDRQHPYWHQEGIEARERLYARQQREIEADVAKRQQAREARAVAVAQKQQEAAINSVAWYDAVDTRIRTHFKDWAWVAIDERIVKLTQEWWEHEYKELMSLLTEVIDNIRERVHARFTSIEERQRSFEEKFAEQRERLLVLANSAEGLQELRVEFKRALEELVAAFGTQLSELEGRVKALPGKLPVAKTWCQESVIYEGEFVCHEGALWQACKDTAQAPGGSDWLCVARGGRDGLSLSVRGGFNAYKKYRQLDVVEFDGSSFIALRDAPGTPGGDGWQVLSRRLDRLRDRGITVVV
jgi:hypothetical protein